MGNELLRASMPREGARTAPLWLRQERSSRIRKYVLHALSLALSSTAYAQDAGTLLREQQRRQEMERLERLPEPEVQQESRAPSQRPDGGETVIVKQLRFGGASQLLSESVRAAFSAEAQARPLSMAGLTALTNRITMTLQKDGRLLARAVLPPQDVTEGVVVIDIIDGSLEQIEFERNENVRIDEEPLRRLAESRVNTHAVTRQDLESALLRMSDFPGVTASGRLAPGELPNTSRLLISVDETAPLSTLLWTDNHGDAGTGRPEAAALLSLTDASGIGEQYQLRGAFSEGMRLGSLGVGAPLAASGVGLRVDYTYLAYDNITELGEALGLEGRSRRLGFGADYALIRSRPFTLRVSLEYGRTTLIDESDAGRLSERHSKAGALRLWGDSRDAVLGTDGINTFEVRMTRGDLDLSRMASIQAADAAGLRTAGDFTRVNAMLARVQSLPADFSLLVRAQAQWANKNLDSSEDFSLGGPYGIRAYPVGEARGDTGHLATLELRRNVIMSPVPGSFQLAGFFDTGRVRINRESVGVPVATATGRNEYRLNGSGLSLRWSHRSMHASATLARTLGSNPGRSALDGSNSDGRHEQWPFWVQCAVRF